MNDRETDIGAQSVRLAATLQEVVSPIAAAAIDYIRMGLAPPHRHCRAQLLYDAISGVMTVYPAVGAWGLSRPIVVSGSRRRPSMRS